MIMIVIIVIVMIIITIDIIKWKQFLWIQKIVRQMNYRFKLDLADKLNLKICKKNMPLVNLSIYYFWKNIKCEYNNKKFKISAPTWNETLPDGSYSISDSQDYFEFIIKKLMLTENP